MKQEDAMKMDNKQAIEILKPLRNMMIDQHGYPISDAVFALDKAIEALQERKRGEWKPVYDENGCHNVCPFCGDWKYYVHQKFCGECGASLTDENLRGAE